MNDKRAVGSLLAKRRADLWTSLVLLVLAAAMLGGALQFPLEGTYAGVRNAWYVSPALFPLIVGTAIAILAAALLLTAVRAGAWRAVRQGSVPVGEGGVGGLDVALIAGLIAAFVVAFIPRVDFIIGATFFLFVFTVAFHVPGPERVRPALACFAVAALAVFGMALAGLTPQTRSLNAFTVDGLVLLLLLLAMLLVVRRARGDPAARRAVGQCIGVALLTPLILGSIFKFFLLVPLPREGVVVVALDTLRLTLRAAL